MEVETLRARLRQVEDELKQKDSDLQLAAEIGNSLLVANKKLEERLAAMESSKQRSSPAPSTDNALAAASSAGISHSPNDDSMKHILMLESSNSNLQKNVDRLTDELEQLKNSSLQTIRRLTNDLESTQSELKVIIDKNNQLQQDVLELTAKNNELMDSARRSGNAKEREIGEYQKQLDNLETELVQSRAESLEIANILEAVKQERSNFWDNCQQLQLKVQELESLQQDYDQQILTLNEAQSELMEARETIHHLSNQLDIYLPKPDQPIDSGNRTLFTEVEDKRVALESEHQALSQKHYGLLGMHKNALHQQERMKNHINRLTQLTQNRANDLQVRRLEELVSELKGENTMLKTMISTLERRLHDEAFLVDGAVGGTSALHQSSFVKQGIQGTEEIIQCLHLRTEQLQNELESVRKQLNTANLIRSSESEKLRKCEMLLAEREAELDGLRALQAKLQFDYDELQLKLKLAREDIVLNGDSCDANQLAVENVTPINMLFGNPLETTINNDQSAESLPQSSPESDDNKRLKLDESPSEICDDALYSPRPISPNQLLELSPFKRVQTKSQQQSQNKPKQVHIKRTAASKDECVQQ